MSISPEDGYNGLTNMYSIGESLLLRIKQTYTGVFFALLNPVSIWPQFLLIGIIFALGIVTFILIIRLMERNKLSIPSIVLAILLVILLPFGMNAATFLSGTGHDLMYYAVWFAYFFGLILLEKFGEDDVEKYKMKDMRLQKSLTFILLGCILWNNVVVANTIYMKKDIEYDSELSKMTRVVSKIEEVQGYVEHLTPVAFIGTESDKKTLPGFEKYASITGTWLSTPITSSYLYERDINYVLNEDMVFCDEDVRQRLLKDARVIDMPEFPSSGSIQMIDGIIVIKMGEES